MRSNRILITSALVHSLIGALSRTPGLVPPEVSRGSLANNKPNRRGAKYRKELGFEGNAARLTAAEEKRERRRLRNLAQQQ